MSGNPRPKGREFNPKGTLPGTQAYRFAHIAFLATGLLGLSILYWSKKTQVGTNPVLNWMLDDSDLKEYIDLKNTQDRLKDIREERRRSEDPYFRHGEERIRLGLSTKQNLPVVPGNPEQKTSSIK